MVGTPPAERARLFLKASEIVKRRRSEIAEVLARETGCTVSFATFQQDLVAATLQQVAGCVYLPKGEVLETNLRSTHSIGVRRPLGVVGGQAIVGHGISFQWVGSSVGFFGGEAIAGPAQDVESKETHRRHRGDISPMVRC
jgi:Aldehyde dehydrogenase family